MDLWLLYKMFVALTAMVAPEEATTMAAVTVAGPLHARRVALDLERGSTDTVQLVLDDAGRRLLGDLPPRGGVAVLADGYPDIGFFVRRDYGQPVDSGWLEIGAFNTRLGSERDSLPGARPDPVATFRWFERVLAHYGARIEPPVGYGADVRTWGDLMRITTEGLRRRGYPATPLGYDPQRAAEYLRD